MSFQKSVYSFKLLREETSSCDLFANNTHENLAKTLALIIENETGGMTIGLEGEWGSGKSTIISILKEKLSKKKVTLFLFDTWAHEGDPLRRVFLEKLINSLFPNNSLLPDNIYKIQEKITNRRITSTKRTNKNTTFFGFILSLSIILIPIGSSLYSTVDRCYAGNKILPYLYLLMMLSPLIVLLFNLLIILVKWCRKKRPSWKDWSYLQGNENTEEVHEESEQEERTSVEFEKYFRQVFEIWKEKHPENQLVMVIDNLDRIDSENARKMWSTLQTFLVLTNGCIEKSPNWNDKIWIIVPYDKTGFLKIWTDSEQETQDSGGYFLDKCFQIRLEVPDPLFTDWENFALNQMRIACPDWDDEEKITIINIMKMTRRSLSDNLTPREIKNFINNVIILSIHSNKEISLQSIAYYASERYLNHKEIQNQDFQQKILDKIIPTSSDIPFLPKSITEDLCGLLFGVSPAIGKRLLLTQPISTALNNMDVSKLDEIIDNHSESFMYIFRYIQDRIWKEDNNSYIILRSAYTIEHSKHPISTFKFYTEELRHKYIQSLGPNIIETLKVENCADCISSMIKLLININNSYGAIKIYETIVDSILGALNKDKIFNKAYLSCLFSSIRALDYSQDLKKLEFSGIKTDEIFHLIQYADEENFSEFSQWIVPEKEMYSVIYSMFFSTIRESKVNQKYYYRVFVYLFHTLNDNNLRDLTNILVGQFQSAVKSNFDEDTLFNYIRITLYLIVRKSQCMNIINKIDPIYYLSIFPLLKNDEAKKLFAALYTFIYNNIKNINDIIVKQFTSTFSFIRNFWESKNLENAALVLNYLPNFEALSEIATNINNKLIISIFDQIIYYYDQKFVISFLESTCILKFLSIYAKFTTKDGPDQIEKFTEALMNIKYIKNRLLEDECSINNYLQEIYLILRQCSGDDIKNWLYNIFKNYKRENWIGLFENEKTATIKLFMEIEKKWPKEFVFDNALYDALFQYSELLFDGKLQTMWISDDWELFFEMLPQAFTERYSIRISEKAINMDLSGEDAFYKLNRKFFNLKILSEKLNDCLANISDNGEMQNKSSRINYLFEIGMKFSLNEKTKKLINQRIKNLYHGNQTDNEINQIKKLIKNLGL